MSVYIDGLMNHGWRLGPNCHMVADTLEELHAMADKIGLKRAWFQGQPAGKGQSGIPHYDLTASRRERAMKAGAVELDRHRFVAFVRWWREGKPLRPCACPRCPRLVPTWWATPMCMPCVTEDCDCADRTQAEGHAAGGGGSQQVSRAKTSASPRALPRGGDQVSTGALAPAMQVERRSPSRKSRLQTNKRQEQRRSVLASHRRSPGHPRRAARRRGVTPLAAHKPVESLLRRLSDEGSIPSASTTSPAAVRGRKAVS